MKSYIKIFTRILTMVVLVSTTASARTDSGDQRDIGTFKRHWHNWCDETVTIIDLGIRDLNKSLNAKKGWTSDAINILESTFAEINPPPSDLSSEMSDLVATLWELSGLLKDDMRQNAEPFVRSQLVNIYGQLLLSNLEFIKSEIQRGDHFFIPLLPMNPWMPIESYQGELIRNEGRYLDFYARTLSYLNTQLVVLDVDDDGEIIVSPKMTPRAYLIAAKTMAEFVAPAVRSNMNGSLFWCVLNRLEMFMERSVQDYMDKTNSGDKDRDLVLENDLVNDTYEEIQAVINRRSECHVNRGYRH